MLALKQSSLIRLKQSYFDVPDTPSVCPRDQKDSFKPDELANQNSPFDGTFVSDLIQEGGGEELVSWISSFSDCSFSRPVCSLDED